MTNNSPPKFKASTAICLEEPSSDNPYQAEKIYLSGFDVEELADKCSYVDTLFLLFSGDFAKCKEDRKLLEHLLVLFSIPSPRHPAARAAMNSGLCKSNPEHLLPISLMALGGKRAGAHEVKLCIDFIQEHIDVPVEQAVIKLLNSWNNSHDHIAPGFGQLYGSIDCLSDSFLDKLVKIKPEGQTVKWLSNFHSRLKQNNMGILDVGIAACVFHELSFGAREAIGLYQLIRAPGLLAYGMEQTHNPLSAIPMLDDSQYELS